MVGWVFISMIRVYQRFVSPLFPPSCRFTPNCSRYTIQAIQKHGPLRGGAMGAWRILRCNPFSKGGYDPVEAQQLFKAVPGPDRAPASHF